MAKSKKTVKNGKHRRNGKQQIPPQLQQNALALGPWPQNHVVVLPCRMRRQEETPATTASCKLNVMVRATTPRIPSRRRERAAPRAAPSARRGAMTSRRRRGARRRWLHQMRTRRPRAAATWASREPRHHPLLLLQLLAVRRPWRGWTRGLLLRRFRRGVP